jgi:hypothetical protein
MRTYKAKGLVASIVLGMLMVLAMLYTVQAEPRRHPFKWPDGKELKICFEGDFWSVAARKENVRKALSEWLSPDDHPAAGERMPSGNDRGEPNPNNDTADDVMDDGDHWDLDNFRWPKVNRSFSAAEKQAMKNAYGTLPTWTEVEDCSEADIVFKAENLGQGHLGTTETTYNTESNQKKKSAVTFDSNPDQGKGEIWHHAADGDGDGKITNNDTKYETGVIGQEIDFYSVAKHEIGHVVSFAHTGLDDLRSQDWEPAGETAGQEDPRTEQISPPKGTVPPDIPNSQRTGSLGDEQMADHFTKLYFASDFAGYPGGPGVGGMDLWIADWDFDNSIWISVTNAGPGVNTAQDEISPFTGEDGATMVFARGDSTMPFSFDLLWSTWDITSSTWLPAVPLPMLGYDPAVADEVSPFLLAGNYTLLFASNANGSFDLWQAEYDLDAGVWLTPTLLPGWVNSPNDDVDPMIGNDGLLYFASNRAGGLGLHDIWVSEMVGGEWQAPTHLFWASTPCEDRNPFVTNDLDSLYLSSNLSGTVCAPLDYDVLILDNHAPRLRVHDVVDPIMPGHVETYTLTYEDTRPLYNPPFPVNAFVISLTYPAHTRFIGADPAPIPGSDNIWGIGDLLPAQRGQITVTLWVSDTAAEAPRETTQGLEYLRVLDLEATASYQSPMGLQYTYAVPHRTWVWLGGPQIYLPIVIKNH